VQRVDQALVAQRLPHAVAAQQQHVAGQQAHAVRHRDVGRLLDRAERRQQHVALRVQARALFVEHAAGHHLLHQAVVGGARRDGAAAKQVGPAVAAVHPGQRLALQVDGREHDGRAHARQRAALGLARHHVQVGLRHQAAQRGLAQPRRRGKARQHAGARGGRGHVAAAVAARAVGHQAGDVAFVVPVAMHVLVVAAAALAGERDDFNFQAGASLQLEGLAPLLFRRAICSS
jgi:hypothetical protein